MVAQPASEEEMQRLLDRGEAQAVVRVLPGFARDVLRGRPTEVQVLVDGTNSNTASLVSSYAGADHRGVFGGRDRRSSSVRMLARSPGRSGERCRYRR